MSTTNPLLTSLLPGQNPSGNTLTVPYGTASASPGSNPLMPALPSGPTSTVSNPYSAGLTPASTSTGTPAVPTAAGTTATPTNLLTGTTSAAPSAASTTNWGAGATGTSPIGAELGVPTDNTGENKTLQTLNKTFGSGLGTAIYNFLAGGAGFNQAAINNQFAALQPGYAQDQQNLLTEFGSSGNRFSSGAQLGLSNLQGTELLNEGQIESQEYETAVTDYINVLMGAAAPSATRKAQQPSVLDQVLSGIGDVGEAAMGAAALLS